MPIAHVAEQLGYVDAAYFSKFFSRSVGQTPSRYGRWWRKACWALACATTCLQDLGRGPGQRRGRPSLDEKRVSDRAPRSADRA